MKKYLPAITIILLLLFVAGTRDFTGNLSLDTEVSAQGTIKELSGYAWSDNIGWINFNCADTSVCSDSNYVVKLNQSTGDLSGYAWSDNVGWVSFNSADVSGCPSGVCQPRLSGNSILGWAKVLATDNRGFDGWISLSCENEGACSTSNYGLTKSGNDIGGYAWGSSVLGWILFDPYLTIVSGTDPPPEGGDPSVSFSANPTQVTTGDSSTLVWSSANVDSCTASGGWSGNKATSGSEVVGPILNTTTYNITCSSSSSSAGGSVTVTVTSSEDPDFLISSSNNLTASTLANPVITEPTFITITPENGFSSSVSFEPASEVTGIDFIFTPETISFAEYNIGTTVEFRARVYPSAGIGDINLIIRAIGGSITKTIPIGLNVTKKRPSFEEF